MRVKWRFLNMNNLIRAGDPSKRRIKWGDNTSEAYRTKLEWASLYWKSIQFKQTLKHTNYKISERKYCWRFFSRTSKCPSASNPMIIHTEPKKKRKISSRLLYLIIHLAFRVEKIYPFFIDIRLLLFFFPAN